MKTQLAIAALALTFASNAASCDIDVPSGDIKDPHTWGDYYLDKYEDELAIDELEPGPAPLAEPRAVLLITGVTIPAEWFEPMEARLVRDGFVPVVYEPPDLLSGDLFENAMALDAVVDQVRAASGQDKIDILAECTGGLIARHYVQSLGGDQKVSRLVTFISPQHGIAKAPLAADLVGWPALDDLSPGSAFLAAVNNAPLPQDVPITSIYTCTDEYIQPYETSIIPGATNIGLCNEFVGHFQFFYDPEIYLVMHGALTEPLPGDGDVTEPSPENPPDADTDLDDETENANPENGDPDDALALGANSGGCTVSNGTPSGAGGAAMLALACALALSRRRDRSVAAAKR